MDKLPADLLLEILSRLDNSADVARCRIASKGFNTLYPRLRSINLQYTSQILRKNHTLSSFKRIFLNLISNMPVVESVCIGVGEDLKLALVDIVNDLYLIDEAFVRKWLPRVSVHLKSLSVSNFSYLRSSHSNVLKLISDYCHNLAVLKLKYVCLSLHNLNPMPMMTSLTLDSVNLLDTKLIKLIKCVPNLEVLNLIDVRFLGDPEIHHLNLKIFQLTVSGPLFTLSLITPNLVTLKLICKCITSVHIQAPMLSHFHLALTYLTAFVKDRIFENLKTLTLSASILSIIYGFPYTKTVENLTVDSPRSCNRYDLISIFTLAKLFTVFPKMSSLCIKSNAWWVFEASYKQLDRETLYLKKGLKTFSAYLLLVDPSLTFSCVEFMLNQCIEVSNVWLLIHCDVDSNVSKSFISGCMKRWPGLKWRWGNWREEMEDSILD
ncbi:hypothetical protein CTI12_AA423350 [Artemisia annua]|uniref:F-box domain, Leucine-rich repeat domain, L domain-like protein n=1 Tax=Artemisia annua TaxID=35608 RepID=A0A2U1M3Q8_ARTAN|nr:hypothetical protein CTI12_AA423350 [Artemisia annua]